MLGIKFAKLKISIACLDISRKEVLSSVDSPKQAHSSQGF
jgi:hypothetical protein